MNNLLSSELDVRRRVGEDVWTTSNFSLLGPFVGCYGSSQSVGFLPGHFASLRQVLAVHPVIFAR